MEINPGIWLWKPVYQNPCHVQHSQFLSLEPHSFQHVVITVFCLYTTHLFKYINQKVHRLCTLSLTKHTLMLKGWTILIFLQSHNLHCKERHFSAKPEKCIIILTFRHYNSNSSLWSQQNDYQCQTLIINSLSLMQGIWGVTKRHTYIIIRKKRHISKHMQVLLR